jgi:NAD(P)-dependent dehydrogenase (short-subunit alcohol dehydrogenase family)
MPRVLENRCAIVTGASQGLGFEIARQYVEAGAHILVCARSADSLDAAHRRLLGFAGPGQSVLAQVADISNAQDVGAVVGPVAARIEERRIGQRIAGHGKIIQLSGGGATSPLPMLSAYATSKAAVVRFMETLAEETRSHRIDVNCIAPGALNTRLLDQFIAAGPEQIGAEFHARAVRQKEQGGAPLGQGAALAVFLGSAASDGITGKLISAVWDPWTQLPEHREDLRRTDVYTLRRIVPQDRDLSWGHSD